MSDGRAGELALSGPTQTRWRQALGRLARKERDIALNGVAGSETTPRALRRLLYRTHGVGVSSDTVILAGCRLNGNAITIGPDCVLSHQIYFDLAAPITLGTGCWIGPRSVLVTSTHEMDDPRRRCGTWLAQPITVEDGCWLGAGVTVLPGVTIGAGCVVAANSLVTRDCEPHGIYAGSPARRVRDLPPVKTGGTGHPSAAAVR